MLELYQTPLDILYFVLTIVIALVGFFLVILLFHAIGLLRNLKVISEKVKDTTDLINHYLWMPIKVLLAIVEKGKDVAEKHSRSKSKKKKKQ